MAGKEAAGKPGERTEIKLDGPLDIVLHQCSQCGHTSVYRHNVSRHVTTKCIGAKVLAGTVTVLGERNAAGVHVPAPAPGMVAVNNTTTTNNITTNNITTNNNITNNNTTTVNVVIPAGSPEERAAIVELFKDPVHRIALTLIAPEAIPAEILKITQSLGPEELRNIRVVGDQKIKELGGDGDEVTMSKAKFLRKTIYGLIDLYARMHPEDTCDPDGYQSVQQKITTPRFNAGKKCVSAHTVALWYKQSHPSIDRLDAAGEEFISTTVRLTNAELRALRAIHRGSA